MMNNDQKPIKTFRDLNAWKESHELVKLIYRITRAFPKDESFGLTSQMRRAAISITSNLAEGFARETYKEKIRFYFISRGSAVELENQLLVAKDVGYLVKNDHNTVEKQLFSAQILINGLIKKSRTFIPS